jgi:hypothetical protein
VEKSSGDSTNSCLGCKAKLGQSLDKARLKVGEAHLPVTPSH